MTYLSQPLIELGTYFVCDIVPLMAVNLDRRTVDVDCPIEAPPTRLRRTGRLIS